MNFHDQRGPSRASLHGLRSQVAFERKPKDEIFACFGPLPAGYPAAEKKTDSGPDFRLTRSRHPSASGRRIGSPPGDGWAARRDPKPKRGVFYGAGL